MTGAVPSEVGADVPIEVGAGLRVEANVAALTEEFIAAARLFRTGLADRAMAALLPFDLAEDELPGRVLHMVAVGLLAITAVTGEWVELDAFRATGDAPGGLVAVMVHLVAVYADLEWSE